MATYLESSLVSRFRYSALAREFAGQFSAPFQESLTSDACILPPAGGHEHRFWSPLNLRRILQIEWGYAETLGRFDEEEKAWQSLVRVALVDCNLLDIVTIGRMSATLVSTYPVYSGPPNFYVLNAVFADVRVAGVPVHITTNTETSSRPLTWEGVKNSGAFQQRSENGAAMTSYVQSVSMDSGRFSPFFVDGNLIAVPDFGRIRVGELAVEPERCTLKLLSAEFEGGLRGQLDLGVLLIDGLPDRSTRREEPEDEELGSMSTNMDEEEEEEVREALGEWLNTEPEPNRPFLFFMGRSLTPAQFFREVEEKTRFGISFMRFLSDQSKRFGEHPRSAIRRAIDANRAE